eukprot:TRINITY_DN3326_c4_g3_i1.p1 TRINITY_DN3326_c4_g3~~TRINITY_DN3326_c4_g3_i1.p1  ORF type:complete len:271 (+),score=81.20 TRINITY_DN3326_c4_g3_i1:158-970(+)
MSIDSSEILRFEEDEKESSLPVSSFCQTSFECDEFIDNFAGTDEFSIEIEEESPKISCITESLFVGGKKESLQFGFLRKLKITHVISLTAMKADELSLDDFDYLIRHVDETPNSYILNIVCECISFYDSVKKIGGKLFVHCLFGISRSVTIVIGILMLRNGLPFIEALKKMEQLHPQSDPCENFVNQLQILEKFFLKRCNSNLPVGFDVDKFKNDLKQYYQDNIGEFILKKNAKCVLPEKDKSVVIFDSKMSSRSSFEGFVDFKSDFVIE